LLATRINYILTSNNFKSKIIKSDISKKDICNFNHRPIITSLNFNANFCKKNIDIKVSCPYYKYWPIEVANNLEQTINKFKNESIKTNNDINKQLNSLTDAITQKLNTI
jgi:hypothetical protein